MRYSRMLPEQQPKRKRRGANLVIIVVILGITAYLVGAGAAGGWLAEHVINPVFNPSVSESPEPPEQDLSPAATQTTHTSPSPASSTTRAEEQITARSISLYTLQSGAFADKDNAAAEAKQITDAGGAGFVAYDGSLYRTLIAGYTNPEDANSVKSELVNQGVTCTVFLLESDALEFKIEAEQAQIDAVKACFDIVPDTVDALQQIIYDADKDQNVDARLMQLKQKADEVTANLRENVTSDNEAVERLRAFMDVFCQTLGDIPDSSSVSEIDFSSNLKYNIISIVVDYSSFLDEISG